MKPYTWKIGICFGLVALSALIVGMAFYQYETVGGGFKLGVDLVGGTILVYEVDQDKFADAKAKQDFEQRSSQLAASLKRRIDPADLYNVTVRQVGTMRVEIILPTGGKHQADIEERDWKKLIADVKEHFGVPADAEVDAPPGQVASLETQIHDLIKAQGKEVAIGDIGDYVDAHYHQKYLTAEAVQNVKEKIAQVGSLEFEILANDHDDKRAQELARKYMERAQNNPKGPERDALVKAWETEKPPPPPREDNGDPYIDTATGLGRYTYSWVEMGRSIRQDMHLDNDSAGKPTVKDGKILFLVPEGSSSQLWHTLAVARGEENLVDTRPGEGGRPVSVYEKAWKDGETPEPIKFQKYQVLPFQGTDLIYSRMVGNASLLAPADRGKGVEYFLLVRNAQPGKEVTGQYLTSAYRTTSQKNMGPAVGFHFNPTGGDLFHDLTSVNAPTPQGFYRHLAIVLDAQIVTAPSLNAVISSEGIIEGRFTGPEVDRYVNILNSGALPASLKQQPVSENTIGATLGQETINKGSWSVGLAFIAVLVFMLVYYRFSGLVACIALLANLLLTVAFMVLVQATFTLPGLAGLVLMLGMAVDANVLIYERLREERDRGATLALAIRNGYDRAFPIIIDTHLSSIFTAIVLYAVGNDQLKGFGISLTVGLIISLFTSLFMTRLMFDVCLAKGWLKKLSMFRLLSRTNIDFMAIRYYWFTATIVLTILGATVFFYRLDKGGLNIDFVGGTAYTGQLTRPMTLPELRKDLGAPPYEALQKEKLRVAEVKQLDNRGMAFEITYVDDPQPRRIDLANPDTPEHVKERASKLPDLSVEQIFLSSAANAAGEGSTVFTVRTTEKAPELVQASIGRLLGSNLKQIGLKHQEGGALWINPRGAVVNLEFTDATSKEPTAVSLDKVRPLVEEALKKADPSLKAPPSVDSVGDAQDGRYQRVALTLQEDTSQAALDRAIAAVQAGLKTQPGDHPIQVASSYTQVKLEFIDLSLLKQDPDLAQSDPKKVEAFASPGQVRMLLDRELQGASLSTRQFTLEGEGAQENGRYKTMQLKLTEPLDRAMLVQVLEKTEAEFSQRPQPERLENFDSQLAAETQSRALYAILASWAAILLYLWFRFGNWTFGAAAVLCLIHDLFFTLGIIAFAHYIHLYVPWLANALLLEDFKIDLPAVAALLTLVGYSVNDTIVVFDRIREVRGKNPDLTPKMINDSVNQTLSRTLLTATTVFLVVIVLYIFGGEGIHLFAFVMVVGVVVGTYSSIYIASPLLLIFGEGTHRRAPVRETVPAGSR